MKNNKGAITIVTGTVVTISIFLFSILQGQVIGANSKAQKAEDKGQRAIDANTELKADLSVVKNDVAWLRQLFEKERGIKSIASSSQN